MTAGTRVDAYGRLKEALEQKIPVAVVTVDRGEPLGAKLLVLPDHVEGSLGSIALDELAANDARLLLEAEKSETKTYSVPESGAEVDLFIETFPLPPTLLIFGAVHV